MNLLSLAVYSISIVGMIAVATVILVNSRCSKSEFFFSLTVFASCIWLLMQYVVQLLSMNGVSGLKFIQLISAISFVVPFLFYGFIRYYINKTVPKLVFVIAPFIFAIEFFLNMSGLMISDAWGEHAGIIVNKSSGLYMVQIAILGIAFLAALVELLVYTVNIKSKRDRVRNRIIMFAFFQAVIIIAVANIVFGLSAEAQMVIPISLLVMSIMISLAIVKYQLFDIKLAAVRTVTYVLSLFTLSILYYGMAYAISVLIFHNKTTSDIGISPVNIALALLLAFVFQPIKKFFDKTTNSFFYKDNYNSDDFFARINKISTMTNNLEDLLKSSAKIIASTIKIDQVFFIAQKKDDDLITLGTNHHSRIPCVDVVELDKYIQDTQSSDKGYLLSNNESELIRRMMVSHKIELIIPLILSNDIVGYLCLGDKKSGSFNSRDINVLKTASDELTIAIQNALAVQEIREFNETLQQRVANATRELRASNAQLQRLDKAKDEFVSMASHQLRTPLTTVKGYISMVMDGDAGEISKEQYNLLNEAFLSSERMVGLINDFLNVSRIQTGKFIIDKRPTDLSKLVEQEIDRLRPSASSRNMEFVYEKPDDFPIINIDEGKMREVVMNFSDNAIYYSHEGSKIKVVLNIEEGNVIFKVKDTGIGVPIQEQARLFSKFYRASNAKRQRPDGTGVGLFLAKKVITAHNGKVLFETVQDEGSTFGFSLPIEQSE